MINKTLSEYKSGLKILDEAFERFKHPKQINHGMDLLMYGLRIKRNEWGKNDWKFFCKNMCLTHPIRKSLHQDPLTFRSFSKPRGYAGDAVLIDFLYREPTINQNIKQATAIGQAVCNYNLSSQSAESVRWRRELITRLINETAQSTPHPEILSVACGHLREAQDSVAVQTHQIKRIVAFDQDVSSLNAIETNKNGENIECVQGNIKDLIRNKLKIGKFDFIYAAGLFDYLSDGAARLLTKTLFKMLKDGGRLLIANFLTGIKECGYMEAFMDWELLYRTKEDFEKIASPLSNYVTKIYPDDIGYVIYLELKKQ